MRNQDKNKVQFEVDLGDWLCAINRAKYELKKKNYGLEITGSRTDGYWLIWNTINQFTLGHELEVIGAAATMKVNFLGENQPVKQIITVIVDKDFEEELRWFMRSGPELLEMGVVNYLQTLNNAMKR